MPRKPKPTNLDNPMRMLRQQLGRISQDRLAEMLGMNGDAIRNLENGRIKKFPAEMFRQIIYRIGAEYRSRRKRWFVVLSDVPCDWNTFRVWRRSSRPSAELKLRDHQALSYRMAALLGHAKPDEYNMVFSKISRLLEECLQQHPNKEAENAFKTSQPEMHIISSSRPLEKRNLLSKKKIRQILAARRREEKKEDHSDEYEAEWQSDEILGSLAEAKAEYRPLSNQEIHEITRVYKDLPDATEVLRRNKQDDNLPAEPGCEKHTNKRVRRSV